MSRRTRKRESVPEPTKRDMMVDDTAKKIFAAAWARILNTGEAPTEIFDIFTGSAYPLQFKVEVMRRVNELIDKAQKELLKSGGGD